ncbi:M48 family metallopeptidase [Liberiplasma polymorphum]|uniref:M48 family metallopeptidase n=1 Tax=Liberiplasma polymorphum TaxID=3374570 RepID=UPI003774E3BB
MIARFILLMVFGIVLLFNSFLDGLNMTVSNSKSIRRNWIKNGLIRFTMFFIVFAVLFLFNGPIERLNLVIGVISVTFLLIIIETGFNSPHKSMFKRFKQASIRFFYKQFIVYLGMAFLITTLFINASWQTYFVLFGVLIILSILLYIIVFKWLAFYFFKQIPYEMPFDQTLYHMEPNLQNQLYIIQSKKLYLPMNALLMGVFKTKKVLLTPSLLGGLNSKQVQAIITHEIGHYFHKHLLERLFVLIAVFISYLAITYVIFDTSFIQLLGVDTTLINYITLLSVFIYILENIIETLFYQLAHKQEYEADTYAASKGYAIALASALEIIDKRQTEQSFHALYHKLKLSHPKTETRIQKLRAHS